MSYTIDETNATTFIIRDTERIHHTCIPNWLIRRLNVGHTIEKNGKKHHITTKAYATLFYLLSLHPKTKISVKKIVANMETWAAKDGGTPVSERSVFRHMKQLELAGHVKRYQTHDKEGKFSTTLYQISEKVFDEDEMEVKKVPKAKIACDINMLQDYGMCKHLPFAKNGETQENPSENGPTDCQKWQTVNQPEDPEIKEKKDDFTDCQKWQTGYNKARVRVNKTNKTKNNNTSNTSIGDGPDPPAPRRDVVVSFFSDLKKLVRDDFKHEFQLSTAKVLLSRLGTIEACKEAILKFNTVSTAKGMGWLISALEHGWLDNIKLPPPPNDRLHIGKKWQAEAESWLGLNKSPVNRPISPDTLKRIREKNYRPRRRRGLASGVKSSAVAGSILKRPDFKEAILKIAEPSHPMIAKLPDLSPSMAKTISKSGLSKLITQYGFERVRQGIMKFNPKTVDEILLEFPGFFQKAG